MEAKDFEPKALKANDEAVFEATWTDWEAPIWIAIKLIYKNKIILQLYFDNTCKGNK